MSFAIQPGQTVLFTGDSITDCGRRGEHRPLRAGYVRMVVDLAEARYPEHQCRCINTGIGGNRVRDLFDRWTDDAIRLRPDWLSVMIGINDHHRWASNGEDGYGVDEYREIYVRILDRAAEETEADLVLMTPFYMSTARPTEEDGWRGRVMKTLPEWIETVEELAQTYDARLVETHRMFQRQLKRHRPDHFGDEPVHPNATGHLMIAHAWLGAMGW